SGWLAYGEGLETELAAREGRQVLLLLGFRAVAQKSSHDVHLGMAGGGVRARTMDLLQNHGRLSDAEARASVGLRDERSQVAGAGGGPNKPIPERPAGNQPPASRHRGSRDKGRRWLASVPCADRCWQAAWQSLRATAY